MLTMRTVALLSMFSRDPISIANSQQALKTMGYMEPDLIFPAVLERAYPALETLLEVSPPSPSPRLLMLTRVTHRLIGRPRASPPYRPSPLP